MSLPEVFSALADPTRLRVVEMLREKALPVHVLAAAFAISRPAISRHLKVLKDVGLVSETRRGRENVYTLEQIPLKPVIAWLDKHGPQARLSRKPAQRRSPAGQGAARAAVAATRPQPAAKSRGTARKAAGVRAAAPAAAPQLSFFDL